MIRALWNLLRPTKATPPPAQAEAPAEYNGKDPDWLLEHQAHVHDMMASLLLPEGSTYFLLHDKRTVKLHTTATVDEVRDFVVDQLGLTEAEANTSGRQPYPYCWVELNVPYRGADGSRNNLHWWSIEVAPPPVPFHPRFRG